MTFYQLTFYFFASIVVLAAGAVVTVKNPVKAALFLVLAFVGAAGVWLTLQAEFLAIVLVLVYVGAVMVLFLFVVMMLDIDMAVMRAGFTRYLPLGLVIAVLLVGQLVFVLKGSFSGEEFANLQILSADYSNTKALGAVLYTDYVLAFELAAFILLVAMIAAISLTHRKRAIKNKLVDPATQVVVRKEDRLKLVDLKSEKRVSS
ncbi:MAG: NADH-quinone oxidoreductase subunit J [Proteobacteria bacterium]|nr:NADH-quinone oxidoreductase subunit J [Pseudomonadota bacterium]